MAAFDAAAAAIHVGQETVVADEASTLGARLSIISDGNRVFVCHLGERVEDMGLSSDQGRRTQATNIFVELLHGSGGEEVVEAALLATRTSDLLKLERSTRPKAVNLYAAE